MKRTLLRGACLEGADLSEVSGLTQDQLAQAILDDNSILPLKEGQLEDKGPEREQENKS